jgi:hypothetical protein
MARVPPVLRGLTMSVGLMLIARLSEPPLSVMEPEEAEPPVVIFAMAVLVAVRLPEKAALMLVVPAVALMVWEVGVLRFRVPPERAMREEEAEATLVVPLVWVMVPVVLALILRVPPEVVMGSGVAALRLRVPEESVVPVEVEPRALGVVMVTVALDWMVVVPV